MVLVDLVDLHHQDQLDLAVRVALVVQHYQFDPVDLVVLVFLNRLDLVDLVAQQLLVDLEVLARQLGQLDQLVQLALVIQMALEDLELQKYLVALAVLEFQFR